jgi:hypothetical protein
MVSHRIIQNTEFQKWNLGGTLSVKFGIYMHQMTIFRGGYFIIVQPIFYHFIIS